MSQSDIPVSRLSPTGRTVPSLSSTFASPVSATSASGDSSGTIVSQHFLATEANGTTFTATDLGLQFLEPSERGYVLKLGETFEALIREGRLGTGIEVAYSTPYQGLLIHHWSSYYKLQPLEIDSSENALYVVLTSDSRIPERRICELVQADSPTQRGSEPREPQSHSGLAVNAKGKRKEVHSTSPTNKFHRNPKYKRGKRSPSASSSSAFRSEGLFHGNSFEKSSPNSRATSPSYSYPYSTSSYEQTPQEQAYDAPLNSANNPGYPYPLAQYAYPGSYQQILPNHSYQPPYPYYAPPYAFQSPLMPQRNPSDSSHSTPPKMVLGYYYNDGRPDILVYHQPLTQPNPQTMHPPLPPYHQNPNNQIDRSSLPTSLSPSPSHSPPPSPSPSPSHSPPPHSPLVVPYDLTRTGQLPPSSRPTWAFGPDIPMAEWGGINRSVRPRNTQTSHNTSSGGNSRVISPSRDRVDVSSASSSTNSSSQRTYYTSATSSLPPRSLQHTLPPHLETPLAYGP